MKIYTKAGDGGMTGLLGPGRFAKDDPRVEAYGLVDELNAVIGVARAANPDVDSDRRLAGVQDDLFVVGSALADPDPAGPFHRAVKPEHAARLEGWIDELEATLEPLRQFILPGGTPAASGIHLARTVCRRAERGPVRLLSSGRRVGPGRSARLPQPPERLPLRPRPRRQRPGGRGRRAVGRAMNLRGKVALITGGRRVGADLARRLAERGADVAMTYHTSRAAIEATVAEVESRGVRGLAVGADLSDAGQAERAVAEVVDRLGRLDVLVNMASVFRRTPLASLTPADFDAMIAANLAAPYHTAVAASRRMLAQPAEDGIKGKIVIVGDWATNRPYKDHLPYLVAKGGLATFTQALAVELAPHVTVNMVQPAMVDPPAGMSDEEREAVIGATPLRRCGTPGDVNGLILYLLEGTDFATGGLYRVDGGRSLA